jgi:N-acetyl-gamma-glutamyl-phosphate reductase
MARLKVGIVGVAGYTGAELVRLIATHPELALTWVSGQSTAGKRLGEVLPSVRGVPSLEALEVAPFVEGEVAALAKNLDVVFTALPHAESARVGALFFRAGVQVVDLSADYRFEDLATYESWYGPHPEKDLLGEARYGLVEWHRDELPGARLIAAPGCYVTAAVLPLAPLLAKGLIEKHPIIIDAKSGVSGAGRKPLPSTHLPEAAEGMRPYKVAGGHRHTAEIEQELSRAAGQAVTVLFTPHLAPMSRGILSVAYATPKAGVTAEQCRAAASEHYQQGLVSVLPKGQLPDTLWVRGTARAHVAYEHDTRTNTILAIGALDNLAKGASAQALQALNVARGWPEALGLPLVAQFP